MSAMHWEARRRQSALERRAAHKQQLLTLTQQQEDSYPSGPQDVSEPGPSAENTVEEQCPHCKSTLRTVRTLDSAAKVPNRFSSLQYKQQW